MNRCQGSVSPNAKRMSPGVKVPSAALSDAVEPPSAASCLSVLPEAEGNSLETGCWDAARSDTAAVGLAVGSAAAVALAAALVVVGVLLLAPRPAEPPHAASVSAAAAIATRGYLLRPRRRHDWRRR